MKICINYQKANNMTDKKQSSKTSIFGVPERLKLILQNTHFRIQEKNLEFKKTINILKMHTVYQ